MKKRGQAATEFLTVYGWAILILLIVIVLIYSLNIFSPKIPNTCIASDPITCQDIRFTQSTNQLSFVISASGISQDVGRETKVIEIRLNNPIPTSCSVGLPITVSNSTQTLVSCSTWTPVITLKEGTKFGGTATVQYRLPLSTTDYTSKVIFSGTAEE